jgi:phosphoribosylcarboxyaminoimidazole (NCAIR) mutase
MGSDSDAPIMAAAGEAVNEFGLTWEMTVASAHRSPARGNPALATKLVDYKKKLADKVEAAARQLASN